MIFEVVVDEFKILRRKSAGEVEGNLKKKN
jgi:hypothetical protein